jgi:hypothetical protein
VLVQAIGHVRTSPLALTPKEGSSTKWRLIQDLSFPRNDPTIPSVNDVIDSDDFPTEWGTFTDTALLVLELPSGCLAATFDITSAYRITPTRPEEQNALCVFWKGRVYVDQAVAFGLASSAGVFGSLADMLVAIYAAAGFGPIKKWVDDFLVIRLPGQQWVEQDFIALTAAIGVPWSASKTRPLASVQRYIGFDWDIQNKTVALPEEKYAKLLQLVKAWSAEGARFAARKAAQLHGKLVYVATIFPLVRPFLKSIVKFGKKFTNARAKLQPSASLLADLTWVKFILASHLHTIPLAVDNPLDLGWWGDASTSFGIGIAVGEYWAVWQWAPGFEVGPNKSHDIGWAEAVAVELGLRLALHTGLVKARPTSTARFLVRSDNAGVVAVTNKGRSRSANTNRVLKHIYQLLAVEGCVLRAEYVPLRDNVTDALSRGDIAAFLAGFSAAKTRLQVELPEHLANKLRSW